MKKTIITKTVDGQEIVSGFGDQTIDPMATKAIVVDKIKTVEGGIERRDLAIRIHDKKRLLIGATLQAQEVLKAEIADLETQLRDLNKRMDAEIYQLWLDNAVHFEPKKGEYLIEDTEFETLRNKLATKAKNQQLLKTGEYISDFRGENIWTKSNDRWTRSRVVNLGDLAEESVLMPNLSESQRKEIMDQDRADWLGDLTADQKEIEKQKALDVALQVAAVEKAKGEIQGDNKALEKAQALFAAESERIEAEFV
jgi:hypothetical protein